MSIYCNIRKFVLSQPLKLTPYPLNTTNRDTTLSDSPIDNLHDLQNLIASRQNELSKRLRQVAEFVLENPSTVALGTLSTIAQEAGVHPSTLIRFAAAFEFDGFSEMQQLFRNKLVEHSSSYRERVRLSYEKSGDKNESVDSHSILQEFMASNTSAIHNLETTINSDDIEIALDLFEQSKTIHIVGVRRSFPIASYLVYSLRQLKQRAFLVDNTAAMHQEHVNTLTSKDDLLIAISYSPYAQETRDVLLNAYNLNIPIVSISDSNLSPLASLSKVFFEVKESEVRGVRSLSASLTLVQSLTIAYANRLEKQFIQSK